jgi:hypothetical protein
MGEYRYSSTILKLDTKQKQVISFKPLMIYLGETITGIKKKAFPVTDRGDRQGCEILRIGSHMAVKLPVLRTCRPLLLRNIVFLLLVLISVRG